MAGGRGPRAKRRSKPGPGEKRRGWCSAVSRKGSPRHARSEALERRAFLNAAVPLREPSGRFIALRRSGARCCHQEVELRKRLVRLPGSLLWLNSTERSSQLADVSARAQGEPRLSGFPNAQEWEGAWQLLF